MLNEFVIQYDKAVMACRKAEDKEYFHTMNRQTSLSGSHLIEWTVEACYTRRVFRIFQMDFVQVNCTHETLSKDTDDNGIGLALWRLTKGSGRWCNTHHTTGYMSDVVAQCLRYYESCASMLYIYIEEEGHETSPIVHFGRWTLSIRYILCCCLPFIEILMITKHILILQVQSRSFWSRYLTNGGNQWINPLGFVEPKALMSKAYEDAKDDANDCQRTLTA